MGREPGVGSRESGVERFDPFSAGYLRDPYSYFRQYRTDSPVFYSAELGYWVVSRYDDIKGILKDPETFSNQITLNPIHPFSEEVVRIFEEDGYRAGLSMVGSDPPSHTRAKKLLNLAFTPRRIAALEPRIRQLVEERLAPLPRSGRFELVHGLTYELPALVLFVLLGVPDEDVHLIKLGAQHRLLLIWGRPTPAEQAELARGLTSFWRYCEQLVERRRREPGDDLTSELIRIRAGDDGVLTLSEITSLIFGLLFAGHETTTAFLANAVRQLILEGAWSTAAAAPETLPATIEELLRLDSSVITWRRLTTRETIVGGATIPAGARVLLLLGSANHDEQRFQCPHQLDPGRANVRDHLAFGFGIHYCLGAALARLEAKVVLECLGRRFPALRLVPDREVEFVPNVSFRGPQELWVEWE